MCRPKETTKRLHEKDKVTPKHQDCKYVIVRKVCFLCGEHAVQNERKLNQKSRLHGFDNSKLEPRKSTPKGLVGTNIHTKTRSGLCGRAHKVKASSRSQNRSLDHPTPPTIPDADPLMCLKVKLVDWKPAPPMPTKEGTKIVARQRLSGAIPAGPNIGTCYSRTVSTSQPRNGRWKDTANDESDVKSDGSRTEPRSNRTHE